MLKLTRIRTENAACGVTTDSRQPRISFALSSDRSGRSLERYRIVVRRGAEIFWDSGELRDGKQIAIVYGGSPLEAFREYTVSVEAVDNGGERAIGETHFSTGRLGTPWQARWITDAGVPVPEKSSPAPLLFRKTVCLRERPVSAKIYATALGIYQVAVNGRKLGDRYFAPGFTSYLYRAQYQVLPLEDLHAGDNEIAVRVGAGWAVGAFTLTRTNRTYADTPSLLMELRVRYADGSEEVIGTDPSWQVSREGRVRFADWYDGEVYDATVDETKISYHGADLAKLRGEPEIIAEYGAPVRAIQQLEPVSVSKAPSGELLYDFGQNFAGVIEAEIQGRAHQKIVFRHAEVLADGELFVKPLRTAKARVEYICAEGSQRYSPTMTYMGFRYVGVRGIQPEDLKLTALVLSSGMEETGYFHCSDERLNALQRNIRWSGRSNFVDIPTDCPQRDERMGWTGDIAVFASTACFNFDMSRFLEKWLLDLASEQAEGGALPMTVNFPK